MKHLSTVSPPINSALVVIVLAIGVTFQIIEALSTAIDSMTWMQNSKTWQAGGPPTIRKDKVFLILSNRFDQKQTLPQNILFASKKYLPWNNTPDLPVARNINNQILIVQQYKQEKITRMIVILKKKRKEKHILVIWLIEQRKDNDRSGKKSPNRCLLTWLCICMNLRSGRIFAAFMNCLQSYCWFSVSCHSDENQNQNRSIDKVQNLGNERRYICEDPHHDSGQQNVSYTRYPKKCFTQIYRDLYGDAMLVPSRISINMADRNQQKHLSPSFATKAWIYSSRNS